MSADKFQFNSKLKGNARLGTLLGVSAALLLVLARPISAQSGGAGVMSSNSAGNSRNVTNSSSYVDIPTDSPPETFYTITYNQGTDSEGEAGWHDEIDGSGEPVDDFKRTYQLNFQDVQRSFPMAFRFSIKGPKSPLPDPTFTVTGAVEKDAVDGNTSKPYTAFYMTDSITDSTEVLVEDDLKTVFVSNGSDTDFLTRWSLSRVSRAEPVAMSSSELIEIDDMKYALVVPLSAGGDYLSSVDPDTDKPVYNKGLKALYLHKPDRMKVTLSWEPASAVRVWHTPFKARTDGGSYFDGEIQNGQAFYEKDDENPIFVEIVEFQNTKLRWGIGDRYHEIELLPVDVDIVHPATGELSDTAEDADTGSGIVAIKRDDETPVTELKIHKADYLPSGSKVSLLFSNGSGENTRYKMWKDAAMTQEVISSTTEFDTTIDTTLYFEGLKKSSAESGESVKQVYTVGTTVFEGDEVKFTVVEAEFDVWLNLFIPVQWGELPAVFDVFSPFGRKLFGGDDRGFYKLPFENPDNDVDREESSSRVHQQITIIPFKHLDADGMKDETIKQALGESHNYLKSQSVQHPDQDYSSTNRLVENPTITSSGTATVEGEDMDVTIEWSEGIPNTVYVDFGSEADNPIVDPSYPINWTLRLRLSSENVFLPSFILTGTQDGFPAYEMYVRDSDGNNGAPEGTIIHQYDPIPLGLDPTALENGVNDVNVFEQGTVE